MYNCMDKTKIRGFFDRLAPEWDQNLVIYEDKMERILDAAHVEAGCSVLDVACGTGVMIDYYLARDASEVTGIDISPAMLQICETKYADETRVSLICGDAESVDLGRQYDCVMVFNAFPHFPDPQGVIAHLSKYVASGGTITVAHDMGRKQLDSHHSGTASAVSHGMMHEDDVAALFDERFDIIVKTSTVDLFIVTAQRK